MLAEQTRDEVFEASVRTQLEQIEAADYDVFTSLARVPTWRKVEQVARLVAASRR